VGYLCESRRFTWKGQSAVLCRAHAHATAGEPALPARLALRAWQDMYAALAQTWSDQGIRLHIVEHLAGDAALARVLFHLGFGAILAENLRDLSAPGGVDTTVEVVQEPRDLVEIAAEHAAYYRRSPIFLPRDASLTTAARELEAARAAGEVWLASREGGRVRGYITLGRCGGEGEGMLLDGTNTAQVKGAFIREEYRGMGVGRSLLAASVAWAKDQGYTRLFVEHETANIWGGAFWGKHFRPYLYVSMRYVDEVR
jgi:GNAT superfamily N-acetyltransferase